MLALERVSKAYGPKLVLKELSLSIGPGEILCLLGPSGCGKTTLLNLLAGLLEPDAGRVLRPVGRPGCVFQEPRLLPWRTAEQNLALGLLAQRIPAAERRAIAGAYLDRLGLREAAHLYPHQLSGGMRQRVALGRAFAVDPAYLLLDEPFRSLDVALRLQLVRLLLDEWLRRPRPVVFVTHDTAEAALAGQRILVLGSHPLGGQRILAPGSHPLGGQCILAPSWHPLAVREEIAVPTPPQERRPDDPEVLQTQARLYALLADAGLAGT